ncbi:MAG: serine/threonine-protein kinase, partial [Acidimicrobiales bacterium]
MATVRLSDQVGRVVSGRYRLVAPLGAGASAQVFLADDVRLERQVAIKMLQPALAEDERFLRRFRAEARTVAAISHPNVVVVHDWGEEEVPYLVTEYLAGGSLRAMLQTDERLTPSQALVVGLDVCRGLAHAHRMGLVHRDLKPANILFDTDGRLRIADFGLARAIAEAAVTEPDGSMVGTVRYSAPEQARGERLDGKADVYALGLLLVEAVTGNVPFTADTTIGTLMARIDRDVEVPEALGPLRSAVERAGRLHAEDRPDAEELGILLLAASERMSAPQPLPLVGALEEARSGRGTGELTRTDMVPLPLDPTTVTPPEPRSPATPPAATA